MLHKELAQMAQEVVDIHSGDALDLTGKPLRESEGYKSPSPEVAAFRNMIVETFTQAYGNFWLASSEDDILAIIDSLPDVYVSAPFKQTAARLRGQA